MLDDIFFMNEALKEANNAFSCDEVPVGAVIVADNRIVARAHNQVETLVDPTAHAEMLALTAAFNNLNSKYLIGCDIYVTLEPCVMCAGALSLAQIKRIIWAADDPKRGFTQLKGAVLHPKTKIIKGVMKSEAAKLLESFFKNKRKT